MIKPIFLIIAAIVVVLVIAGGVYVYLKGQTPVLPGGDKDTHGCIGSAGYTWCAAKNKCLRSWEENCTEAMPGSDRDEHGCIGSAGYTWCPQKNECLRSWEEPCNSTDLEAQAKAYCGTENVAAVYLCADHYRVVSSLLGGGSKFYFLNGTQVQCPLVSPDSESPQCRLYLTGMNCVERDACVNNTG